MRRLLKITDNGNGILVQGTDNILYPDNATLTFPYNSIILVTDESDIATFRSASNNDVLFSGLIGKIEIGSTTVTKANIIDKFDEIANQESGGGEPFDPTNYYTKTDADGLFATQVVVNQEIAARIAGDNALNTALGAKADKSDTYTKEQTDQAIDDALANIDLSDYVDIDTYNKKETAIVNALTDLNENKADKATTYTKTQVDQAISGLEENKQDKLIAGTNISIDANNVISASGAAAQIQSDWNQTDSSSVDYIKNKPTIPVVPDMTNYYTKTETDDIIVEKEEVVARALTELKEEKADKSEIPVVPDMSNYYTKTQTDSAIDAALADIDLSDYVDKETFDTKEEVISTALNELDANKQDVLTAGANITIQNNVISATGGTQLQSDWNQSDSSAVDFIKNKPTIPTVPTNVSAFTNDAGYLTQHQSLANYYTKSETDNTFVDKSTFDTKEEVISSALNNLDERIGNINTILESI